MTLTPEQRAEIDRQVRAGMELERLQVENARLRAENERSEVLIDYLGAELAKLKRDVDHALRQLRGEPPAAPPGSN